MFSIPIRYKKPLYFAAALHLILLIFFIFNLSFSDKSPVLESSPSVMKATLVDQNKMHAVEQVVQKVEEKQQEKEVPAPAEEQARLQKIKEEKLVAEQQLEKLQEEKKQAAIALKKQQEVEKQRQLALQKEQAALKKQQQLAEEKKRKTAEAVAAKKRRAEAEKQLQQQLSEEEQEFVAKQSVEKQAQVAKAAQMQGEVDRYKALILNAIRQRWIEPEDVDKNLSSQFLIRVAPGGMVLDVQLLESSGDTALDRSARAAVFKASPLPVPNNPLVFEQFREFTLTVKPG